MTISTRSTSSPEPTVPTTSFPVHWCFVPSRRTARTPRERHGLSPNTNWTKHWLSTASKTVHSSNASKKRPCTFLLRMLKPLSDWRHTTLSAWNSWYVPFTYPKNPITYVSEYTATHLLCDTVRGVAIIEQEQQAVHGNLLHGNGTKRQRPQALCASMADMPAPVPLCICLWLSLIHI